VGKERLFSLDRCSIPSKDKRVKKKKDKYCMVLVWTPFRDPRFHPIFTKGSSSFYRQPLFVSFSFLFLPQIFPFKKGSSVESFTPFSEKGTRNEREK